MTTIENDFPLTPCSKNNLIEAISWKLFLSSSYFFRCSSRNGHCIENTASDIATLNMRTRSSSRTHLYWLFDDTDTNFFSVFKDREIYKGFLWYRPSLCIHDIKRFRFPSAMSFWMEVHVADEGLSLVCDHIYLIFFIQRFANKIRISIWDDFHLNDFWKYPKPFAEVFLWKIVHAVNVMKRFWIRLMKELQISFEW